MAAASNNSVNTAASNIIIVDDHLLFADGLELLLSQADDPFQVVISCDAEQVIGDSEFLKSFDLLLVDLHMPRINGFNFLQAIQAQNIAVKVIVVSGTEDSSEVERAIQLGAMGFIPKDSPTQEMLRGIRQVLAGQRYLPPQYEGEINWQQGAMGDLEQTDTSIGVKQLQVLKMMGDGMQNRQIAAVLGVSVSAVKRHIEVLFKVLHVNNRTACVQAAVKQNLI